MSETSDKSADAGAEKKDHGVLYIGAARRSRPTCSRSA